LGFDKMAELGAPRKAIIFTESKRTQEYLHRFLQGVRFAGYSPGPFVSLRSPAGCGLRARPFPVVPA